MPEPLVTIERQIAALAEAVENYATKLATTKAIYQEIIDLFDAQGVEVSE